VRIFAVVIGIDVIASRAQMLVTAADPDLGFQPQRVFRAACLRRRNALTRIRTTTTLMTAAARNRPEKITGTGHNGSPVIESRMVQATAPRT
jgi:hypothetical protein